MNVCELLRLLQTEHDETTARADTLREQIERLTTALTETEAHLAELTATRKVIDGPAPPGHATAPAETATACQRIVTTFNEHPGRVFRVRDLHEHLGLPTDEPSTNVTRSRLGRLVRQGLLAPRTRPLQETDSTPSQILRIQCLVCPRSGDKARQPAGSPTFVSSS